MSHHPAGTDGGWGRAGWRAVVSFLVPFLSPRPGPQSTLLDLLRVVFSTVAFALPLLLLVLTFVVPWTAAGPVPPTVWVLLGAGVASLGGTAAARRRPLPCRGRKELGQAYLQRTFLGIAFSEAPALLGFVAAFLADAVWPYLVGVGLAAAGLAMVAPTDGDVARREAQLRASGCAASLREALASKPRT